MLLLLRVGAQQEQPRHGAEVLSMPNKTLIARAEIAKKRTLARRGERGIDVSVHSRMLVDEGSSGLVIAPVFAGRRKNVVAVQDLQAKRRLADFPRAKPGKRRIPS